MTPAPIVEKTEYNCISAEDGFLQLMDLTSGELKEDIKMPEEGHLSEVKQRINAILEAGTKECLVSVQKWGDKEQACAAREGADQ